MKRTSLIRLGGLAGMVSGTSYAVQGLLAPPLVRLLVPKDVTPLDPAFREEGIPPERVIPGGMIIENISTVFFVLLLLGAMAAIAALHALQRELYGPGAWERYGLGALTSLMSLVGIALILVGDLGDIGSLRYLPSGVTSDPAALTSAVRNREAGNHESNECDAVRHLRSSRFRYWVGRRRALHRPDYYWKSLSYSGVRPTWSGLANSRYVGELRVRLRNFLCGVSLRGRGPGQVGVDERVKGASGKPPRLLLGYVDQVDQAAPVHPLVEPHGGVSIFDELH